MKPERVKGNPELLKMMENLDSMDETCAIYRGQFIHEATLLETQIDEILVEYFCSGDYTKKEELMYLFFYNERGVNFMVKYQALSFIMHRYFKSFYNIHTIKNENYKKKQNESKYFTIDSRIELIIGLRNKFAHRKIIKSFQKSITFDGDKVMLDIGSTNKKSQRIDSESLELNRNKLMEYKKEIKSLRLVLGQFYILIKDKNKKQEEEEGKKRRGVS